MSDSVVQPSAVDESEVAGEGEDGAEEQPAQEVAETTAHTREEVEPEA